jgi:hypothetical protein
MKKLLSRGGTGLSLFCAVLVVVGLSFLVAPSSHAQTQYTLTFNGFPDGSGGVDLSTYIGLDRKLKTNVPSHTLTITPPPGFTGTRQVRLSIQVVVGGSLAECNRVVATAVTVPFAISGGGRTLGASDFTGSGIGIQTSDTYQPCIDALSDKITKGVAAIPSGIYTVNATLNDASTGAFLGSGSNVMRITAASVIEAILNLSSPQNGEQVRQSPSMIFNFSNTIPGRLLVFEHSSLSQSPDDATRDDNSPLKVVDVDVKETGSPQFNATYPGTALRPWTAGKKYSWYFRGSTSSASGSADIKKSPVWSFTVVSSDPMFARLVNAIQSAPDPVGSTYTNLVNSGYTINITSPFYLQEGDNAAPQSKTVEQILSLLSSLAQKNVQIKIGVTQ